MKLTPLSDRVILKMAEAEETTKGGACFRFKDIRRKQP